MKEMRVLNYFCTNPVIKIVDNLFRHVVTIFRLFMGDDFTGWTANP